MRTSLTGHGVVGKVTVNTRDNSGAGAAVPLHTTSNVPENGFLTETVLIAPGDCVSYTFTKLIRAGVANPRSRNSC